MAMHAALLQVVFFDSAVETGLAVAVREAEDEKRLEAVDGLAVAAVSSFRLSVSSSPVVFPFLGDAKQVPHPAALLQSFYLCLPVHPMSLPTPKFKSHI